MNTENDKLIEDFMDWKVRKFSSSDWNDIMEVVEKIQSIPSYDKDKFGTIVKIEGRNCSIKSDNYGDKNKEYSKSLYFNANYSGNSKLEAVYKACFEYIKWHNEQK